MMVKNIPSGQQELLLEHRDITTGGVMVMFLLHVQMKASFSNTIMVTLTREKNICFNSIAGTKVL